MRFSRRNGLAALPAAVLMLLAVSRTAWADAIDFSFVFFAGAIVLIPLLAFEVFVEGIFLAWGLKVPYRKVLVLALLANLASLAAGVPVKIFNTAMYAALLPRDLAAYFRAYPRAVGLGTLIYFLVTLATEYAVVLAWCRSKAVTVAGMRLALTVLAANLATYAVLAPLNYVFTRPIQNVRVFTDASEWASRPLTELYYVDATTGHLCSIMTDGSGRRELTKDEVQNYQILREAGSLTHDKVGSIEASTEPGLASRLRVTTATNSILLADNPGLLHLSARQFNDVCILSNAREVVFDDHHGLYLLDVNERRVGKITDGSSFIIPGDTRLRSKAAKKSD